MRFLFHTLIGTSVLASVALVACTTSTTSSSSSSGGSSGTTSSSGGSSSGTTSSSGGSSSGNPPASTASVDVTTTATCPTFAACGGTLSGTYDYTAGCVGDVFSDIRAQCAQLDTTAVKATVTGSIYFLANNALNRDVTTKVNGTLTFPVTCTGGSCAVAEMALKDSFPGTKCTLAGNNCSCAIDRTDKNTNATTITVAGNTVTTADGDKYDFCDASGKVTYKGKTSAAEDGVWELKKR
jgi:hypothetical protein